MIVIQREGGHPTQSWTFDGWFLEPSFASQGPLIFDGSDLIAFLSVEHTSTRWQFDGRRITLYPNSEALWQLDGELLHEPTATHARWRFDGRILEQDTEVRPDRWIATDEVPVLVMAFVAGLL